MLAVSLAWLCELTRKVRDTGNLVTFVTDADVCKSEIRLSTSTSYDCVKIS